MAQNSLIKRIIAGDEEAVSELFSRYGNMVYYTALAETDDESRALEVTKRAFNQTLNAIRKGDAPDDIMKHLQKQVRLQSKCLSSEESIMEALRENIRREKGSDAFIDLIMPRKDGAASQAPASGEAPSETADAGISKAATGAGSGSPDEGMPAKSASDEGAAAKSTSDASAAVKSASDEGTASKSAADEGKAAPEAGTGATPKGTSAVRSGVTAAPPKNAPDVTSPTFAKIPMPPAQNAPEKEPEVSKREIVDTGLDVTVISAADAAAAVDADSAAGAGEAPGGDTPVVGASPKEGTSGTSPKTAPATRPDSSVMDLFGDTIEQASDEQAADLADSSAASPSSSGADGTAKPAELNPSKIPQVVVPASSIPEITPSGKTSAPTGTVSANLTTAGSPSPDAAPAVSATPSSDDTAALTPSSDATVAFKPSPAETVPFGPAPADTGSFRPKTTSPDGKVSSEAPAAGGSKSTASTLGSTVAMTPVLGSEHGKTSPDRPSPAPVETPSTFSPSAGHTVFPSSAETTQKPARGFAASLDATTVLPTPGATGSGSDAASEKTSVLPTVDNHVEVISAQVPEVGVNTAPAGGGFQTNLAPEEELAGVDSALHEQFYGEADALGSRKGRTGLIVGIVLVVILAVLLVWLLLGFLSRLGIIPPIDLGYSWFNETIYPLF